jgi:hypothetical protein
MKHALAFAVAALLAGAAHAVDVYKWTDSKGVVHYGDRPASGAAAATLNVPGDSLSAADEAAANARLAQARAKLSADVDADSPTVAAHHVRKAGGGTCEDAWKQYDAAAACFSRNRVTDSGKGVTSTGAAVCKEIPQPTCAR